MSFDVLVGILHEDAQDQEQVSPNRIHLTSPDE
jgi:hypothetical protein